MCELTQVMSREPWDSWRFNLPEQPSANELCRWVYESPSFPVPWRNYSSCIPESCLLILQWKWAPVAHCGDLIINIFLSASLPSVSISLSFMFRGISSQIKHLHSGLLYYGQNTGELGSMYLDESGSILLRRNMGMEVVHQTNSKTTTNDLIIKKIHYNTWDCISCTKQRLLIS